MCLKMCWKPSVESKLWFALVLPVPLPTGPFPVRPAHAQGGACEEMQAANKIWSGEHGASPSSDTVFFTIAISSRVPGTMLSASSFHCVLTTSLGVGCDRLHLRVKKLCLCDLRPRPLTGLRSVSEAVACPLGLGNLLR